MALMGDMAVAYMVLVGRPEGKCALGITRRRWKDNFKIHLQEIGWVVGMNWIDLAQDRERWRALVNAVMNLRVP